MVICVSAVITRANSKVTQSMIREAVIETDGKTNTKGEGAIASCHGIIKAARGVAMAHGAKEVAVRAAVHGAKAAVVSPPKTWMR